MKILPTYTPKSIAGSVLVFTLVMTAVAMLTLIAYLKMVKTVNYSNMRSQAWNASLPIIEAGLEEALTHLNVNSNNIYCDGWNKSGSIYWIGRNVPEGYYIVTISNYASGIPVIESRGFSTLPVLVADATRPGPFLAYAATVSASRKYMARGVRITARKNSLWAKGLVAKGNIDLNGNNVTTDSYDSSDPTYSTNGRYDSTKSKDNGDVATNSSLTNSFNVGNADIMGRISTGPGGKVMIGANGSVGDKQWVTGGHSGIQTGHSADDMNVNFADVAAPPGGGVIPAQGGGYTYLLVGGKYEMTSVSMSGNSSMRVTAPSTLYVKNGWSMTGNSKLEIAPTASLILYIGGSGKFTGKGIANESGDPMAFQYFGLPSNTDISIGGNAAFAGTIYAPQAYLHLSGGGNDNLDFQGAAIVASVKMNGHFNFHFDESLRSRGPGKGYVVTSWDEMTPSEVKTLPAGVYVNSMP